MINIKHKDINYTLSTGAIEHVKPSKEAIEMCKDMAIGKTSADLAVVAIKKKYGLTTHESVK